LTQSPELGFGLLSFLSWNDFDFVLRFALCSCSNCHASAVVAAVLMEIPIAMILASRLLPFRANRLANIIAGAIETLAVISMQFVYPLASGAWHEHMFPSYTFFGTIETVCTSIIIWKAWTWSGVEAAVSSGRIVRQPGSWDHFFLTAGLLKNVLERFVSLELIVPTANGRVDERNRLIVHDS
jgi:hypothetical protein